MTVTWWNSTINLISCLKRKRCLIRSSPSSTSSLMTRICSSETRSNWEISLLKITQVKSAKLSSRPYLCQIQILNLINSQRQASLEHRRKAYRRNFLAQINPTRPRTSWQRRSLRHRWPPGRSRTRRRSRGCWRMREDQASRWRRMMMNKWFSNPNL